MEHIQVNNGNLKAEFIVRTGTQDEEIVPEVWETNYYFDYLNKGGYYPEEGAVIIDIGAHIGSFAVMAGLKGYRVFAFEPMAESFKLLENNVARNGFSLDENSPITLKNAAVTADGRNVNIGWNDDSRTGCFTISEEGQMAESISIVSLLNRFDRVGMIKLDCEGAELEILQAMTRYEFEKVDSITLEFHGKNAEDTVSNKDFIANLLGVYYKDVNVDYAEGTNQGRIQSFNLL